ncbi:putative E3 ubiquitin-protein ligase XBAT34 [Chenopodium quinoa]|uniref:RING-type domain-containing protein n=1 Tax=Chenopodium quinoa TaxID=63459 RepID=A0A803M7M5_CHEQI|nr:putative E3 ubiquitin-protein ligase XBAT34 [Chenopodium quinoa]
MGQKQSRDKLLYDYVINGDVGGIQFLSKQGAGLEWKKEGKTPLIVAAKDPGLYDIAKILIELGANVNAYCKESHGGTPLHYAAKEGLKNTVALLLTHGANAFVKNRERQTPLDVARKNGRNLVVKEIESRICYFAGPIRETLGPGWSDVPAPQSSSTRISWIVVVPRSPHNPPKPPKIELVIYSTAEDAEPRKIISLSRYSIKAPRFDQPSPCLIISNKQTKYKFSSVTYSDRQQLRRLYNACKGISQVMPASAQMMISDAIGPPMHTASQISSPAWRTPSNLSPPMTPHNSVWVHESPRRRDHYGGNHWGATQLNPVPLQTPDRFMQTPNRVLQTPDRFPAVAVASPPIPSAPPINNTSTSIDEVFNPSAESAGQKAPVVTESTVCVVCWEAPVEGACVPCGHVSTCMSCLKKIKDDDGGCPVCRAEIDQVVKLYGI